MKTQKEFEQFYEAQDPSVFNAAVDRAMHAIRAENLFKYPRYQKLLEAWILGRFGEKSSANSIHLNSHDFPDGYANIDNELIPLEICEAYNPGRRRADEYARKKDNEVEVDPVTNWLPRCESSIEGLKRSIDTKCQKNYDSTHRIELLIYLSNCGSYGLHSQYMQNNISISVRPALEKFKRVWVLWDGNLDRFD